MAVWHVGVLLVSNVGNLLTITIWGSYLTEKEAHMRSVIASYGFAFMLTPLLFFSSFRNDNFFSQRFIH